MKLLSFYDFILEAKTETLVPLIISSEFMDKIGRIDSPISDRLIIIKKDRPLSEFSFISSGDSEDTVKFTDSRRLYSYLQDESPRLTGYKTMDVSRYLRGSGDFFRVDDEIWRENRTEIKIGRFIKRLFGTEFSDPVIEAFVNGWKSLKKEGNFEIWTGDRILEG